MSASGDDAAVLATSSPQATSQQTTGVLMALSHLEIEKLYVFLPPGMMLYPSDTAPESVFP